MRLPFVTEIAVRQDPRLRPDSSPTRCRRFAGSRRSGSPRRIATHSPILLAYPGLTIYLFGTHLPRRVQFRDTEHYQVTRSFLEHPDRMLREFTAGHGIDPD
jgi:hypothetical protein